MVLMNKSTIERLEEWLMFSNREKRYSEDRIKSLTEDIVRQQKEIDALDAQIKDIETTLNILRGKQV